MLIRNESFVKRWISFLGSWRCFLGYMEVLFPSLANAPEHTLTSLATTMGGECFKDVSEEIVLTNFPNLRNTAVWDTEKIALPCLIGINKQPHNLDIPISQYLPSNIP